MLRLHRLKIWVLPLPLLCGFSGAANQAGVSPGVSETLSQAELVVPALRIGPLQLGMTLDEVFGLQSFHPERDQDVHFRCGIRWLNFLAPDFRSNLIVYARNGKVVQIEALYPENYHTTGGIRSGTKPQYVVGEFPDIEAFANSRPGSKIAPHSNVYWVQANAGIAFELQFDPWEGSYEVFRIAVFHQDRLPLVGCADVAQEWLALGEAQLPPIANVPKVIGSLESETDADKRIEHFICVTYECLKAGDVYYYDKVDLDTDGRPEVIVYIQGAGHCGSGGCTFLVLKEKDGEYISVSRIASRPPVLVTSERSQGWKNLVVWFPADTVEGGGNYVLLRFNGTDYMGDAGRWPILDKPVEGEIYLGNPLEPEYGVVVQP